MTLLSAIEVYAALHTDKAWHICIALSWLLVLVKITLGISQHELLSNITQGTHRQKDQVLKA